MSEEDRIEALTLYEKMFDDADDEQNLVRALENPTRQAFVIARAYDARRRKLSGRDAEEAETPAFVRAILRVYEDVVPVSAAPEYTPAPRRAPAPLPEERAPEAEAPQSAGDGAAGGLPEPDEAQSPRVLENQVTLFDEPDAGEHDAVSDFIDGFQLPEDALPEPEPPAPAKPRVELHELFAMEHGPAEEARYSISRDLSRAREAEEEAAEAPRRETNVPLLIVYVLFAVPLTVCGILLLLIPTLLSLVLAAAAIFAGCAGMAAAVGSFAVFADMLIVFGCSLVALALGLLFLWLFIWFVSGPTVALVRGVIRLGSEWCGKEVSA